MTDSNIQLYSELESFLNNIEQIDGVFSGFSSDLAEALNTADKQEGGVIRGLKYAFIPGSYAADTSVLNTVRSLQYNAMRDSVQFKLQAMGQCLQAIQIQVQQEQGDLNRQLQKDEGDRNRQLQKDEGDRNRQLQKDEGKFNRELQQEQGNLNRDLQKKLTALQLMVQTLEGEKNRALQEKIAKLQREVQIVDGEKNRALQAYIAELQRELQKEEGILNRELQANLAQLQREFQEKEGQLNRSHALQLEMFREALQIYLFDRQKELQLELQQLNANLARELKLMDLANSKALISEQRRQKNFPINMSENQLIKDRLNGVIPFNLFFVPPIIQADTLPIPDYAKDFPAIENFLNESLGNLVTEYNQKGRIVDYYDSAWVSKSFKGRRAVNNLFEGLKPTPTGIIDCLIEQDELTIFYAYWSDTFRLPNCQNSSTFLWKELLYGFAKERLIQWYIEREQSRKNTGSTKEFDDHYDEDTIATYQKDLKILEKELKLIAKGKNPRKELKSDSRKYYIMPDDIEKFRQILAQDIHLIAGLMIDEYYLLGVAPQYRKTPLLPELFPSLLQGCPPDLLNSRVFTMINSYEQMYQLLGKTQSAWIPELRLDLAQSLLCLTDKQYAKQQLNLSLSAWLNLRGLPQPEDFSSLLLVVSAEIKLKDLAYINQLNQCLLALGETYRLSVENSCYERGIRHYQQGNYQSAIVDLSEAIILNPNLMDAYLHRGKAYDELGQHQEAKSDFRRALELQGHTFEN